MYNSKNISIPGVCAGRGEGVHLVVLQQTEGDDGQPDREEDGDDLVLAGETEKLELDLPGTADGELLGGGEEAVEQQAESQPHCYQVHKISGAFINQMCHLSACTFRTFISQF